MGCVWCKPSAIEDSPRDKSSSVVSRPVYFSSRREEPLRRTKEQPDVVSVRPNVSRGESLSSRREKRKTENVAASNFPMGITIAKGVEGEYVAAGGPPWLASVAGEAIKGWVPRRADSFEKLDKIGQGTYSNSSRPGPEEDVALKKVRAGEREVMAREIQILRRLDHPNIIKLEGLVTSRMSCSLYLVFEYMEHDLAGLASHPAVKFSESQVKCYLQQLLRGLDHCHSRDNSGVLKIADFGLASFFDPNQTQPLTSRVVTLWYRPTELLLGATRYGAAVDLWSTGCILAELYAGKPIMPGGTAAQDFQAMRLALEDYWVKSRLPHATIFKPTQPNKRIVDETFKEFPQPALALLKLCFQSILTIVGPPTQLSKARPLPCDPSSLPKYPPSKELDARMRDEESRRRGRARLIIEAEARSLIHILKKLLLVSPIDPPRSSSQAFEPNRESQGNIMICFRKGGRRNYQDPSQKVLSIAAADYSAIPGFAATRTSASQQETCRGMTRLPGSFKETSEEANQEENGRSNKKDSVLLGYGSKGHKIHYSGPLVVPSGNMDQVLKDHDRHIQEAVRRARIDKARVRKHQAEEASSQQVSTNHPSSVSSR
ncbi:LOW QUALITY PROTEIN: hypothetical protein HID58_020438 [Brassica napus]|uniref:Protein kinase domain-containing protein n=1 Tax=Brassica napus TaxID=3708 RepID=A0ABQ7XIX4_BRANA|nr:LOW QUALITY PROTEIN: hypothetical protein HID58_020438 [Brassica napus]